MIPEELKELHLTKRMLIAEKLLRLPDNALEAVQTHSQTGWEEQRMAADILLCRRNKKELSARDIALRTWLHTRSTELGSLLRGLFLKREDLLQQLEKNLEETREKEAELVVCVEATAVGNLRKAEVVP